VRCYEKYSRRAYVPLRGYLVIRPAHRYRTEVLGADPGDNVVVEATVEATADGVLDDALAKGVLVLAKRSGVWITKDLLLVHIADVLATFTEGA
jgi:hypothetical protein